MLENLLRNIARLARSPHRVTAESLPMRKVVVRALLFRESAEWCAQCLDFDIAVQAPTRERLLTELETVLITHVEIAIDSGREPFAGLQRAPARFFEFFEQSRPTTQIKPIQLLNRDEAPSIVSELRYLQPTPV
jgi:hypothetical protein